jgi:hypothetical protein
LFKAIWHEKQTLIVLLWSGLIFIGYNVLTVQADVKEDALREMKFVNDDEDDSGLKPLAIEQACKDNGGKWKENIWCKFDNDKTGDEIEFEHQLEDRGLYYYYADSEEAGFSDEWKKYEQEKYEQEQENEKDNQKYLEEEPTKIDGLFEDELERDDVDKYCYASEDYKKHPKQCDRYYKIVEKLEEDIKKRVDEYNQNTPVEDRPVTCDGGMTYSAAGTVCSDSE